MKLKKYSWIVALLVALLLAIVGCGGSGGDDDDDDDIPEGTPTMTADKITLNDRAYALFRFDLDGEEWQNFEKITADFKVSGSSFGKGIINGNPARLMGPYTQSFIDAATAPDFDGYKGINLADDINGPYIMDNVSNPNDTLWTGKTAGEWFTLEYDIEGKLMSAGGKAHNAYINAPTATESGVLYFGVGLPGGEGNAIVQIIRYVTLVHSTDEEKNVVATGAKIILQGDAGKANNKWEEVEVAIDDDGAVGGDPVDPIEVIFTTEMLSAVGGANAFIDVIDNGAGFKYTYGASAAGYGGSVAVIMVVLGDDLTIDDIKEITFEVDAEGSNIGYKRPRLYGSTSPITSAVDNSGLVSGIDYLSSAAAQSNEAGDDWPLTTKFVIGSGSEYTPGASVNNTAGASTFYLAIGMHAGATEFTSFSISDVTIVFND